MAHAPGPEPPWPECLRRRGARSWCGRTSDRRERGATVAWLAGASRGAALHFESRPERSGAEWRTPRRGVGVGKPCGTIVSHVERLFVFHLLGPQAVQPGAALGLDRGGECSGAPVRKGSPQINRGSRTAPSMRTPATEPHLIGVAATDGYRRGRSLPRGRARFCSPSTFGRDRRTGGRCARRARRRRGQEDPG